MLVNESRDFLKRKHEKNRRAERPRPQGCLIRLYQPTGKPNWALTKPTNQPGRKY